MLIEGSGSRDLTLTYDGHNNLWKLVIDHGNRADLQTEDILDTVIDAITKVSELGGGKVRFSFHSDTYPLGCHTFTERDVEHKERRLTVINDNLSFVAEFATNVYQTYARSTLELSIRMIRFKSLNFSNALTKIWDTISTIAKIQVTVSSAYSSKFKDIVTKIL